MLELRVNFAGPYEWAVPSSASFRLLGESKVVEGEVTKHLLEILPRQCNAEIPESSLVLQGTSYHIPPASFVFDSDIPDMGLKDIGGSSRETRLASEAVLLAGLELRKRKPAGSIANSLRALGFISSISRQSIPDSGWRGIDIVRSEWQSVPRKLEPNLVVADWIFRTALAGLRAIQASEVTALSKSWPQPVDGSSAQDS